MQSRITYDNSVFVYMCVTTALKRILSPSSILFSQRAIRHSGRINSTYMQSVLATDKNLHQRLTATRMHGPFAIVGVLVILKH